MESFHYGSLKAENEALQEELAQCQADKDFVFSLWKRLQVANPDVTQAVGLVIKREREKAEHKDRKVLGILTAKDDEIASLTKSGSSLRLELDELKTKYGEEVEARRGLQGSHDDLEAKLSASGADAMATLREESEQLRAANERLRSDQEDLAQRLTAAEQSRDELRTRAEAAGSVEARTQTMERDLQELRGDLEHKRQELEATRRELSDLWSTHHEATEAASQQADLIHGLRAAQTEHDALLRAQDDAHALEAAQLREDLAALRTEQRALQEDLRGADEHAREQDDVITELQRQLDVAHEPVTSARKQVDHLQSHVTQLQERLHEKDMLLAAINGDDPGALVRVLRASQPPGPRAEMRLKLQDMERRLADTRDALSLKKSQLEEVQRAHDARLLRMRGLNANFRLVKKHLAEAEKQLAETGRQCRARKVRPARAKPHQMRREDSDAVWNELAFYKEQNKHLKVQKDNVEEELSLLKVQAVEDANTIHELKTCLGSEREDLMAALSTRRDTSRLPENDDVIEDDESVHDVDRSAAHEIQNLNDRLTDMIKENRELQNEREKVIEKNRDLMTELSAHARKLGYLTAQLAQTRAYKQRANRQLARAQGQLRRYQLTAHAQKTKQTSISRPLKVNIDEPQSTKHEPPFVSEISTITTGSSPVTSDPGSSQTGGTGSLGDKIVTRAQEQRGEHVTSQPAVTSEEERPVRAAERRRAGSLRQRLLASHKQVALLRGFRSAGQRRERGLRSAVEKLKTELLSLAEKLHSSTLTNQRLAAEIERLRSRDDPLPVPAPEVTLRAEKAELQVNQLQHRITVLNQEVGTQGAQLKDVRSENAALSEKVSKLEERNKRCERDAAQKRILVDEMRNKLKITQENTKQDSALMAEIEAKINALEDRASRAQTQLESARTRVKVIGKERSQAETRIIELEKIKGSRETEIKTLKAKIRDLQATSTDLEAAAQQQLHALAAQSEAAIDAAQLRLTSQGTRLAQHQTFIRTLLLTLQSTLEEARRQVSLAQDSRRMRTEDQLRRSAQTQRAADILNLSASELASFLTEDDTSTESGPVKHNGMMDKGRLEKLINSEKPFALPLVEYIKDRVRERTDIARTLAQMEAQVTRDV